MVKVTKCPDCGDSHKAHERQAPRCRRVFGFENAETSGVALMIDNDDGALNRALVAVAEVMSLPGSDEAAEVAIPHVAQALKVRAERWIEYAAESMNGSEAFGNTVAAELASCALAHVNWYELAEHYIGKAREQAKFEAQAEAVL